MVWQSVLCAWNFAGTLWGYTFLTMMPDILHVFYIGFWIYIRAALRGGDARAALADERMETIYPGARLAELNQPGADSYWSSGASFTATEHAGVMMVAPFVMEGEGSIISRRALVSVLEWHETHLCAPYHTDESLVEFDAATRRMVALVESTFPRTSKCGWNLIKVHLLLHITEAIKRAGRPREFSTAVYENADIRTCKIPYRASNRRQHDTQIVAHNATAALLTTLPSSLAPGGRYNTALRRAIATESPQPIRKRTRMLGRSYSPTGPEDIYSAYDAALEEGVGPYAFVMREHGLRPFPAWVHRAMALPPQELDHTIIRAHYVHATPTLHGEPAFSFVEYLEEDGEVAHGRIHLLLSLDGAAIREDGGAYEVAFVRRWLPEHVDECTGCTVMRPGSMDNEYTVVELARVQRSVHMVRSFKEGPFEVVWSVSAGGFLDAEMGFAGGKFSVPCTWLFGVSLQVAFWMLRWDSLVEIVRPLSAPLPSPSRLSLLFPRRPLCLPSLPSPSLSPLPSRCPLFLSPSRSPSRHLCALPPVAFALRVPSPVRSPSHRLSALLPVACPLSLRSPVHSPSRRLPHSRRRFAIPSPFLSLTALPVSRRPSSPVALLLSPPAALASHRDRVPNALPSPSVPPFIINYLPSRRSSSLPSPPVDPLIPCPRSLPSLSVALALFPPFPSPSFSPLPFRCPCSLSSLSVTLVLPPPFPSPSFSPLLSVALVLYPPFPPPSLSRIPFRRPRSLPSLSVAFALSPPVRSPSFSPLLFRHPRSLPSLFVAFVLSPHFPSPLLSPLPFRRPRSLPSLPVALVLSPPFPSPLLSPLPFRHPRSLPSLSGALALSPFFPSPSFSPLPFRRPCYLP
ncbi:unnamed protein product, partial [Closterium sp. Naga37s-1]